MAFLSLPGEVRNIIYKHLLIANALVAGRWKIKDSTLDLGILYTNKTIYREATWILYSQNIFNCYSWDTHDITNFINQIGHDNANHIQSIEIRVPDIENNNGTFSPDEDSICSLEKIRSHCLGLKTIRMTLLSIRHPMIELEKLDRIKVLSLLNDRFREISSLREVRVALYDEEPACYGMRQEMENLGWNVVSLRRPHSSFIDSDCEADDMEEEDPSDYDSTDESDHESDIDNDGGFLRRSRTWMNVFKPNTD